MSKNTDTAEPGLTSPEGQSEPETDAAAPGKTPRGVLSRPYLMTTLGACALVFIAAFEAMAVTTIMPLVARDLDGQALYALAFAGAVASGVVGMVAAGAWADRSGPTAPILTFAATFALGLIIAGTATDMGVFIIGRLVQGLGGGAINVSLTVLVARSFPPSLHPRIFAAFSAAWVIPSIVGPFAAGVVAEASSWHWVFIGVVFIVPFALAMLIPTLRRLAHAPAPHHAAGHPAEASQDSTHDAGPAPAAGRGLRRRAQEIPTLVRVLLAAVVAAAVLALNLSVGAGPLGWVVAVVSIAVAVLVASFLLPAGVFTAQRGLPSIILTRFFASAAFFAAEVYIPYVLMDRDHFSASLAGLGLTFGAVAWAAASTVQGRLPAEKLTHEGAVRIGTSLIVVSMVLVLLSVVLAWSPFMLIFGWMFAGAGMGLTSARLSVLVLARSRHSEQGFNVSALTVADSIGTALALAISGFIFHLFGGAGSGEHAVQTGGTPVSAFVAAFVLTLVAALAGWYIAARVKERSNKG